MKLSASSKFVGAKVLAGLCLLMLICGTLLCSGAELSASSERPASQVGGDPQLDRARRSTELAAETNIANAKIQVSGADMSAQAAHHGKSYGGGKYYMYAESPKKGAHKFGYKRGNHKFSIEAKESAHKSHVHGYVKWHDKKGKGSHKYEYKHSDHKKKKHHY